jgi:hypothetical protein
VTSGRYVILKAVRLYFVIRESTRYGDLAMEDVQVMRLSDGYGGALR